jgi:hypothetical protein
LEWWAKARPLPVNALVTCDPPSRSAATANILAKRFEQEMKAGRLTRTPSAKVRGRALVDLLQGLQLRAKAGIARAQLLQDARS